MRAYKSYPRAAIFSSVSLNPGTYTLHQYDDAAGGCACGGTCGVTTKVFADNVTLQYLSP